MTVDAILLTLALLLLAGGLIFTVAILDRADRRLRLDKARKGRYSSNQRRQEK